MTIPASSAPAARSYLFNSLTAQLTPDPDSPSSSLLVCYDTPGTNQPDDIVSVGRVHRNIGVNSLVGGGAAGWLEEDYTVEIVVDVFRGGDSAQAAFTRASALIDAIVSVVRSDLTLGGAVLRARPQSDRTEVEWDEDHMGQRAQAHIEISCYQRI